MSELFAAFGVNWKLLLAQAVNFGVLLLVLWHFLYKPVLKMIDERREKVAEGVKNAEEAARNLAVSEERGAEIVAQASRDAEGLVSEARARADEKRAQLIHAAEGRAADILDEAHQRAEEAKRQALAASEREITKAAILAAEKILKQKLT